MRALRTVCFTIGLTAASSATPVAIADTLEMRSVGQAPPNTAMGVMRPSRGMTMSTVRAQFGNPMDARPAVGRPPITRWVYDDFTVYFEHQYVIHSVINR